MSKSSKNLRAKRRRRLKADSAVVAKLSRLNSEWELMFKKMMGCSSGWAEAEEKLKICARSLSSLEAAVDHLLRGRLAVKVIEDRIERRSLVRARYSCPRSPVQVPLSPGGAFGALAEKINALDPVAAKVFMLDGFSFEFFREFDDGQVGAVVLASVRDLAERIAMAILDGVCKESLVLSQSIKEADRV